jgi:hypothetical protein
MSTPRQYQFDVDTKRYLNRVNTYRSLNGLPDIQKSDAADIDNFVIGLKDLNLWQNTTLWLMRSVHNISVGSNLLCTGGGPQLDITLINSPSWTTNGITFNRSLDQYGLTRVVDVLNDFGAFVVVDHDRNNGGSFITQDRWSGASGDGGFNWLLQRNDSTSVQLFIGNNTTGSAFTNITAPTSGFMFHGGIKSIRGNSHSVNGGAVSTVGSVSQFLGTKRMAISLARSGWGSGSAMSGTMAAACYLNTSLSPTQQTFQSLNSLLRATICKDILTT